MPFRACTKKLDLKWFKRQLFRDFGTRRLEDNGSAVSDSISVSGFVIKLKHAFFEASSCSQFESKSVRHYFLDLNKDLFPGFRTGGEGCTGFTLNLSDCVVFDSDRDLPPQLESAPGNQGGACKPENMRMYRCVPTAVIIPPASSFSQSKRIHYRPGGISTSRSGIFVFTI